MASAFLVEGRLRTVSKCLAHRRKTSSGSVNISEPSALRRGEEPHDDGWTVESSDGTINVFAVFLVGVFLNFIGFGSEP